MSFNKWTDKHIELYVWNGILLGHKEEQFTETYGMDEIITYTKSEKSGEDKEYRLHDPTYIQFQKRKSILQW